MTEGMRDEMHDSHWATYARTYSLQPCQRSDMVLEDQDIVECDDVDLRA